MVRKFNPNSIADSSLPGTKIQTGTIPAAAVNSVRISSVVYTSNVWVNLDDTAVGLSGGYIKILGSNFEANSTVTIESFSATAVTYVSSTELRAQVPAATAGSKHLYVINSDGAVAIRVNGINYSAEPTWSTASTLTTGEIDVPISISLSANSNSTVSYTLQAGSSLPSGLTLAANGLLSGTVTGLTINTTYNFTVEATDLELQNTPRAFSITINAGDQYFAYTTTLLSASTPGTASFASDASTNAFNVNIFGDARPGNFNPFRSGYFSNYFDGDADYLSVAPNAAFTFGTGNFTVEMWIYIAGNSIADNSGNRNATLVSTTQSGAAGFSCQIFGSSTTTGTSMNIEYRISGSTISYGATVTVPQKVWNHVAWVRSGTTLTFYLNGVNVGTATSSENIDTTGSTLTIGGQTHTDNWRRWFNGYISNLRIVKGTAVYTGNFTPSTVPLTNITNTSLLTCQSDRFVDNSSNNFTLTASGAVYDSTFDPFIQDSSTASYGSVYLDGTGDYLTAGSVANWKFLHDGASDWTVELWFHTDTTTFMTLVSTNAASASVGIFIGLSNSVTRSIDVQIYRGVGGSILTAASSANVWTAGAWNHLAVTFNTSTKVVTVYSNGTSVATANGSSFSFSSSNPTYDLAIGRYQDATPAGYYTGYISNLRILNGTRLYTSNFTPPTAPLTAIANTSLLTAQTNYPAGNGVFLDTSTNNSLVARNGNTTGGSFNPLAGGYSVYFNGTTGYLTVPSNTGFNFGTGDFTIEMWVYTIGAATNGASTTDRFLFGAIGNTPSWTIYIRNGTALYSNWYSASGGVDSNIAISPNTWTHIAFVRASGTLTVYVNGVSGGSAANTNNYSASGTQYVGRADDAANKYFPGYISNLRVVKGTALYTANFTPSTTPLTPVTNTSLLICADNRFIDDSGTNLTITRNGDVRVQRLSPFAPRLPATPTSYGMYFDGNGDYLSVPDNTALDFGNSDITIECWVYITGYPLDYTGTDVSTIVAKGTDAQAEFNLYVSGTTSSITAIGFTQYYTSSLSETSSQSYTFSLNTWYHVAVTRSSNTVRLFVNGSQVGSNSTFSQTQVNGTSPVYIGGTQFTNYNYWFKGHISNLRILKGTALYTANFTPSTTSLTNISNTSLLTCQSTTAIDNSSNSFAVTTNGEAVPSQFNPFGFTGTNATAYSPDVYGGSAYFDGTGDYLTVPDSPSINVMGSNFTVELWFYPTATPNNALFGKRANSSTFGGIVVYFSSSLSPIVLATVNGSSWGINSTSSVACMLNAWNHIVLSRNGDTWKLFVNGVAGVTATLSGTVPANTAALSIGAGAADGTQIISSSYISNFRLVTGQALYTNNFLPPTAPLTQTQNTTALVAMSQAAVYDSSMINLFETVGGARASTVLKKYGSASIYFDGAGDSLSTPSQPALVLNADFTVECWTYLAATNIAYAVVFGSGTFYIRYGNSGFGYKLQVAINDTSVSTVYSTANTQSSLSNTWVHMAFTRASGVNKFFVNGVQQNMNTGSNPGTYPLSSFSDSTSVGGSTWELGYNWNGYLTDFRVTNGLARYTTNFTPTETPFFAK